MERTKSPKPFSSAAVHSALVMRHERALVACAGIGIVRKNNSEMPANARSAGPSRPRKTPLLPAGETLLKAISVFLCGSTTFSLSNLKCCLLLFAECVDRHTAGRKRVLRLSWQAPAMGAWDGLHHGFVSY